MTDDRLALAFLGTFESLRMAPTFARGRRDERAGHVRQLTISGSLVVALVRGPDDPKAFPARIAVRSFGASEWARVEQDLVAEARFAADLLAGRMPAGIGEVFAGAGLSLVPLSLDEVAMDCTCERWPMPCVHLAATCYALARSFEEDPFGVFAWRGRHRDELLLHLRELRASAAAATHDVASRDAASRGGAARRGVSHGGASHGDASGGSASYGGDSYGGAASHAGGGHEGAGHERAGGGSAGIVGGGRGGAAHDDGGQDAAARHDVVGGGASATGGAGRSEISDISDSLISGKDWADDFWGGEPAAQAAAGGRPGAVSRPDALLDQLDPPPLSYDGRPVVDLLRPAYLAMPEE